MISILLGFLVFGRSFIILWAGNDYVDAYLITICFFVSLYIPLIQNIGITILQARNQMKFRSVLYILIASFSLVFQIMFSKWWGGIGCAFAISGALILGQGLIMNIYYARKQRIAILYFWRNIFKMNIVPILFSILFYVLVKDYNTTNWMSFSIWFAFYVSILSIIMFKFSLNSDEKQLFVQPIRRLLKG
jgi:O-antigen/teichoic acid export membrane protein